LDRAPAGARLPGLDPLEGLREECAAVSEALRGITEEAFATATRCPSWDLKELVGHLYDDVDAINHATPVQPPATTDTDAVSYWRSYDITPVSADARSIAESAKRIAARYRSGTDLAQAWDDLWIATADAAEGIERTAVVASDGLALTFDDLLRTRVLEVTVHRMDLEDALGRRGWGTGTAVGIVDEILVELLGAEPPTSLDWDVVDFIETGTGRRELTDDERKRLGPRLTARFPLLA